MNFRAGQGLVSSLIHSLKVACHLDVSRDIMSFEVILRFDVNQIVGLSSHMYHSLTAISSIMF